MVDAGPDKPTTQGTVIYRSRQQRSLAAGGATARLGASVSNNDGFSHWAQARPDWRGVVSQGLYYTITAGKSITYGTSVSALGVSVGVQTMYNSAHTQRIDAGYGHATHDIWGARGGLSNRGTSAAIFDSC